MENWTCIHILCLLQIKNQEISASIWLNLWLCIMHNTLVSIFYYFCWLLCTLAMLIHLHLMQLRTITNPIWWGLHFVFIRIVCAFFFFFLMCCLSVQLYKTRDEKYLLDLQRVSGPQLLFLDLCAAFLAQLRVLWFPVFAFHQLHSLRFTRGMSNLLQSCK